VLYKLSFPRSSTPYSLDPQNALTKEAHRSRLMYLVLLRIYELKAVAESLKILDTSNSSALSKSRLTRPGLQLLEATNL